MVASLGIYVLMMHFFILVYLRIARNLHYESYIKPVQFYRYPHV